MRRYRPAQQEIEQYYFEMFRKVYQLPAGTVLYRDKPDMTIGGNKLGIEITNFYLKDGSSPSSEQKQYRRRIESVSKAQKVYEQGTGKNFQLSFSFNTHNPILDSAALVEKLVELARRVDGGTTARSRNRSLRIFRSWNLSTSTLANWCTRLTTIPNFRMVSLTFLKATLFGQNTGTGARRTRCMRVSTIRCHSLQHGM
jgi:hypothetical protein